LIQGSVKYEFVICSIVFKPDFKYFILFDIELSSEFLIQFCLILD